jgi:hypothetical protein
MCSMDDLNDQSRVQALPMQHDSDQGVQPCQSNQHVSRERRAGHALDDVMDTALLLSTGPTDRQHQSRDLAAELHLFTYRLASAG